MTAIWQVVTRLNIGGPAQQIRELANDLDRRFKVTVLAGHPPSHEGEVDRVPHLEYVPLVRPIHPSSDVAAFMSLRAATSRRAPDIVHTHMAKAGVIGRSAALSVRERPRTVHTFHGHVLSGYFAPAISRAFVEIERRLARRTDALVAVSATLRDELLALGIGDASKFHVIPLGLDVERYARPQCTTMGLRAALGIAAGTPLVGYIGRLTPIKDHETAFNALRRVPEAHMLLIGDGELRQDLRRLAASLEIAPRVHFLGWRSDIADLLAELDVVLLTSRSEGTPLALIEAAAAGRAIVATDVGGVRDIVQPGVSGVLCRPRAATEVGAALLELLCSPPRRAALGAAAQRHARATFGKAVMLERHAALYEDLTSRR